MQRVEASGIRGRIRRRLALAAGLGCASLAFEVGAVPVLHPRFSSWRPEADALPEFEWLRVCFVALIAGLATASAVRLVERGRERVALGAMAIAGMTFILGTWVPDFFSEPRRIELLMAICVGTAIIGSILGLIYGAFAFFTLLLPSLQQVDSPAYDSPATTSFIAARHLFLAALVGCIHGSASRVLDVPVTVLGVSALAFFVFGWIERSRLDVLRASLIRGQHPSLTLAAGTPALHTLPLTAIDAAEGTKRLVCEHGTAAYRDNAMSEVAYLRAD